MQFSVNEIVNRGVQVVNYTCQTSESPTSHKPIVKSVHEVGVLNLALMQHVSRGVRTTINSCSCFIYNTRVSKTTFHATIWTSGIVVVRTTRGNVPQCGTTVCNPACSDKPNYFGYGRLLVIIVARS